MGQKRKVEKKINKYLIFIMNLTDNQFIEILERSEKIIDKLLNELPNDKLEMIRKEIDNLPVDQK